MALSGKLSRSSSLPGSLARKESLSGRLGLNPSAIPITVDNALSLSSTNPVQNRVITAAITNRLLSDDVKNALLQIVQKVAYIDADGQDYYDALFDALYPPVGLDSIVAVFDSSATIYNTDTLDDLKQYLTVTAYYTSGDSEEVDSYTLSGSMDAGTQTITVAYGGKTTTFSVTVVEWVTSISAVFTQGSATIYDTDSLDTLEQYLVVTATYADSTTATVTDYTLSGTLVVGTSTITVSYGGKTDTFTVTVTQSATYVTSGLAHRWDAIDNTGSGHGSSASTWKDLVGSVDLTVSGGSWDTNALSLSTAGSEVVYSDSLENLTNATIEVCFKYTGSTATVVATFNPASGSGARDARRFCLFTDNTVGGKAASGTAYTNPESGISAVRTMAVDYSSLTINNLYVNGTAASLSSATHSFTYSGTHTMSIAGGGNSYRFYGKIYSIRIYNRALTAAEVAQNYAYDVQRFELGGTT